MNLLETLFDWVVSTTIRASLVAVAILAIQMLLRRWLPAKWRHPLWLPLLLVMILPFVPALPVHLIPARQVPAVPVVPVVPANMEVGAFPEANMGNAAEVATAPAAPAPQKLALLPILWLLGVCIAMTAGITGYRQKLRAIRAHALAPAPDLRAEIEEARKAAGLSKTPLVWLSREVESPAVSGLLRPVLLLPAEFPAAFSATESRLILLHEFSHIKRHDLAQNWLLFALQSLHWFNPVIWFAFARVRMDRESACDARVLALDAQDRRSDYGHALLKMQDLPAVSGLRLGFLGIFENASGLRSRITDIARHRRSHPAWQVAGSLLVAVIALFGSTRAEEVAPKEEDGVEAGAGVVEVTDEETAALFGDDEEAAPAASGTEAIMNKLKTIVIPVVKFENTSLVEAVDFMRSKSKELDTVEKDPAKKGVNFIIRKPRGEANGVPDPGTARVTMDLKNVTMLAALEGIAKQTKLRFSIDESGLTFLPADDKPTFQNLPPGVDIEQLGDVQFPPPPEPRLPAGKAAQADNKIIIPTVEFEDVSLTEAVALLNKQAKELAKGQPVFPVVLDAKVNGETKIKELRLRNVPLTIAVKYVCEVTKHSITASDTEIRISKP